MDIKILGAEKIKKFISIILMCNFLLIFNGCLFNHYLWRYYDAKHEKQISAGFNQIYYSCIDGNCNEQKILLPYKLNRTKSLKNEFPPFDQGYIILKNKRCLASVSEGIKDLVAESALSKNASIYIRIIKTEKYDESCKTYLKCYLNAEQLNQNSDFSILDEHQSIFQREITRHSEAEGDGSVIYKGTAIFSFGEKACKNHQGRMLADINFMEEFAFTSADDKWLPILPPGNSQRVSILFMTEKVEKTYQESATKRIVLTPFYVIADIITAPFLLITYERWGPR